MPTESPLSHAADGKAHVLIVASSLSAKSRSRKLGRRAAGKLQDAGVAHTFLDLSEEGSALPFAGSDSGWGHAAAVRAGELAAAATHVLFAVPIYNYDVNSVAKNFIELMGKERLGGKTVGFLVSAGGKGSYMAVASFANSLMFDFRCWITPRFVYVSEDFGDQPTPEIDTRIDGLLREMLSRG